MDGVELSVHPAASIATPAITPMTAVDRIFMMAPGLVGDSGQPGSRGRPDDKSQWSPSSGPSAMGTRSPRRVDNERHDVWERNRAAPGPRERRSWISSPRESASWAPVGRCARATSTATGGSRPGRSSGGMSTRWRRASTNSVSSAGDRVRDPVGKSPRVAGGRPRDPVARRDQRARVPDERGAAGRPHPRPTPRAASASSRTRSTSAACSSERERLADLRHIVVFDGDVPLNDPLVLSFEHLRALGAQALETDGDLVTRARARGTSRRRRDARVHQRHDRTAEGRRAHARQHHGDAALGDAHRSTVGRRSLPLVPPAQPHHGALGLALRLDRRRWRDVVGAIDLHGRGGSRRLSPDDLLRGAARLGEVPRGHRGARRRAGRSPRGARAAVPVVRVRSGARGRGPRTTWRSPRRSNGCCSTRSSAPPLRRQVGLDCARLVVSGAAPIHPDLVRWFTGIRLPIAEGYGQTEVALVTTLNPTGRDPHRHRRAAGSRCVRAHRARRRDPREGRQRVPRLLAERGRHAASSSTTTAGSTPATSARSTTTATCASPVARRT